MNLLINPTTMVQDGYTPPPLGLLYMAAMDPETLVFDAAVRGDPIPFIQQTRAKVVGVSMYSAGRKESLKILACAKEAGAVTVAGGPHVAVMTEQLISMYPFIDHFVIGDGELAWKALCNQEKLPKVIKMPTENLDMLPIPRFDAVDLLSYPARGFGIYNDIDISKVPRISVVLGRGCAGRCTFCSTWWVNGRYRAHGKTWMEASLSRLWDMGVRHLVFQDDCLSCNRQAVLDLCTVLKQFKFAWFGTTRADMLDLTLAVNMKESGCYELSFGLETGSQEILRRMNKLMDLNKAFEARIICAKAGIKFTALMMFGFPFENQNSRRETEVFLQKLRPDEIGTLGHVMVLPGTALYQTCKEQGLIDDSFWLGDEPYYIYRGGLEGSDKTGGTVP